MSHENLHLYNDKLITAACFCHRREYIDWYQSTASDAGKIIDKIGSLPDWEVMTKSPVG